MSTTYMGTSFLDSCPSLFTIQRWGKDFKHGVLLWRRMHHQEDSGGDKDTGDDPRCESSN
ncbi:Hypothetical protein FKW44_018504 [Caligus rogercresseyi]|uniref:Uncharacterized protein n=1 Tax=Caligus rogercresseyi TaxID=217165 RepID=A0A7T8GUK9_CALRO|nr:Hypothetical protein FKW44_018504 [Caligus rogercresseyi]